MDRKLTHYQRTPNSPWVTMPLIGKRSVYMFLLLGTYTLLRYEFPDGTYQIVAKENKAAA